MIGNGILNSKVLLKPKFSADGLETLLQKAFGDLTLRDARTRVLVPAFNITQNTVMYKKSLVLSSAWILYLGWLEEVSQWNDSISISVSHSAPTFSLANTGTVFLGRKWLGWDCGNSESR